MSKFSNIPADACVFAAPAVQFRSNGEGSKTAPFSLLARSAQPIEHWYWGKVVHDFAGMKSKKRITMDYNHDPDQIVGFANKTTVDDEGLHLSGTIVSVEDGDRADTIMKQSAAGVPFEASIFFGGDGIKIEEVDDGQVTQVNGTQFAGPGIVIREWPLRGCAICPYGADGNTHSKFSEAGKSFAAVTTKTAEAATMPTEDHKPAPAADPGNSPESNTQLSTNSEAVETPTTEAAPAAAVEVVVQEAEKTETEPAALSLSVSDLKRISAEFGNDIAIQTALTGGTYSTALSVAYEAQKAELTAVRAELAALKASGATAIAPSTASPAKFADGEKPKRSSAPIKMRDAKLSK